VICSVRGVCDGEYVDQKKSRIAEGAPRLADGGLDWERIERARLIFGMAEGLMIDTSVNSPYARLMTRKRRAKGPRTNPSYAPSVAPAKAGVSDIAKRLDLDQTRPGALRDLKKWVYGETIMDRIAAIAYEAGVCGTTVHRWGQKWPEVRKILEG
jgi:hypothetical protein